MQERTVYSVFNEVAKSLYPALAGAITDVKRFMMTNGNPDADLISYYSKINQALLNEKRYFYQLSDAEIKRTADTLSAIVKKMGFDKDRDQLIIEQHRPYFDNIISRMERLHG